MNTTKRVRKIVNDIIEEKGIPCFGTWTDRQYFGHPERKERYVTYNLSIGTSDQEQLFLDCVKKYMRMNGITDCNPRMVSGYLRMNSYLG